MENYKYIDGKKLFALEKTRRIKRLTDKLSIVGVFVLWILYFSLFGKYQMLNDILMYSAIFSIPGCVWLRIHNKKSFLEDFKQNLVRPNIDRNFDGFSYFSTNTISRDSFDECRLFEKYNRYSGDDYIEGEIEDIPLCFSEINAAYVSKSSSTDSGSSSYRHTVFKGLFLVADLPDEVCGHIIVKPRFKIEKIPKILRFLFPDSYVNPPGAFPTGIEKFDREFTLESSDKDKALKIIDSKFTDTIFKIGKRVREFNENLPKSIFTEQVVADVPLFFSIIGDKLYIAASGIRLFDPDYKKDISKDVSQLDNSFAIILRILAFAVSIASRSENKIE